MLYKKDEIIEVEITALKPYGAFAKVDSSIYQRLMAFL